MEKELKYYGIKNSPEIHSDIKMAAKNNYMNHNQMTQEELQRIYLTNISKVQKAKSISGTHNLVNPFSTELKNVVRPFNLSFKNLLWSNILRFYSFPHKNKQAQEINVYANIIMALFSYSVSCLHLYVLFQSVVSSIDLLSEMIGLNLGLTDDYAKDLISNKDHQ